MYRRSNAAAATTAIGPRTAPATKRRVGPVCRAAPMDPGAEGTAEVLFTFGVGEEMTVALTAGGIVVKFWADMEEAREIVVEVLIEVFEITGEINLE